MLLELLRKVGRSGLERASDAVASRLPEGALGRLSRAGSLVPALLPNSLDVVARLAAAAAPVVVVPIHEAPDELQKCLAALAVHTPRGVRILLIDDASKDPRVGAILADVSADCCFEVRRNPGNLGFTRTVNLGMQLAGRADVILLNSDTEVTPRWLENLRLAAYSDDRIGTVTPFSNNAGVFSAPVANRPNMLPDGLTLDAYARLVTQVSMRRYPRLPTGHGFCLFIRRDCIDDVGPFDSEAFPLGYGEENDFCMRAGRQGWSHVVDDATYVYHVRSASFGEARAELLKSSGAILAERYPEYAQRVRGIGRNSGLARARADLADAVAAKLAAGSPVLPRALFVIGTQAGGTPQTNQDLMAALAGRYETFVLHCDSRQLSLSRFRDGQHETLERVRLPAPLAPFPHVDANYDRIVASWIAAYSIDLVHIRHLVWHSLSLPRIAQVLGVPVVFSFHDYYAICPTVRLVDENDVFCGGDCTPTEGPCRQALWKTTNMPPLKHQAVHDWRAGMAEMMTACDAFVTTSEETRERIQRFFPATRQRPFPVIEHGRDFPGFDRVGRAPSPSERVRILVPGNISTTKGARILRAVQALDREGRFEFHVLGQPSRELKNLLGVVTHGTYDRARFGEITQQIAPHFGVVLSIWPETYCHTLTEMWASGLPVAAYDLGAVGERIRRHGGGWLIQPVTAEAAYDAFLAIVSDRARFDAKLAEIAAWQSGAGSQESCGWMAEAYAGLYESVCGVRRSGEVSRASG